MKSPTQNGSICGILSCILRLHFERLTLVTMGKVGDKCQETVGGKKDEETSSNETIAEASAGPLSEEGTWECHGKDRVEAIWGQS